MRLIGEHEIPCLEDTDYAAIALYMQCLAEQVEAELVSNQTQIEAVFDRPFAMWQVTSVLPQGSGSNTTSANAMLASYHFNQTFSATSMSTINTRGWWQIGAHIHATSDAPAGGAGNNRILALYVFPAGTATSLLTFTSGEHEVALQDITWESNTATGEDVRAVCDVYNSGDPNVGPNDFGMRIRIGFSVENGGAENVTFSGFVWAAYLGDTPAIQAS